MSSNLSYFGPPLIHTTHLTMKRPLSALALTLLLFACNPAAQKSSTDTVADVETGPARNEIYETVPLTTDISQLSEAEKKMIPILIEAAKIMDDLFWREAYPEALRVEETTLSTDVRRFLQINYGPWDRLDGNKPFVPGIGTKPAGSGFYPLDMTKEEFDAYDHPEKGSLYTLLRRDEQGALETVWYHEAFADEVTAASSLLKEAAALAEDEAQRTYLNLRAEALLTDQYDASDIAWLDMKNNGIDIILGPIETYEDQLMGKKAAHEAYVLVKDKEWSRRLAHYVSFLTELQTNLPVEEKYKAEQPGTDAELNAYDVVYYAGDCNAGSKTIAVNLPNDETIQQSKGTRRSQLKNAMRAKYDKILLPISEMLIAEDQRKHITFEAFFANTMFHEVAHGLGIKNTLTGKGTVREALQEQASALEEGKADIVGLYMVTQLFEKGELKDGELMDYYVTFLASIFRSVRFGASSAHGKANMLRFNYFEEQGAFARDEATGTYRVDFEKMQAAMNSLSALILRLQGDGDYEGVKKLMEEKGRIQAALATDLNRVGDAGIPVDIVFDQGVAVLGL